MRLRRRLGLPLSDARVARLVEARRSAHGTAEAGGDSARGAKGTGASAVAGLVFSFDRALQLHGLLSSYFRHAADPAPLTVLFRTSSPAHRCAYDEVASLFARPESPRDIAWIAETSFKSDLETTLASLASDRVFFLVDDIVFTHPFAFADFASLDPRRYVVSLRHGRQLRHHYALDRPMALPAWREDPATPAGMSVWRWREGKDDWNYPLSVDGHVFDRLEFLSLLGLIPYKAPNSLEHGLQAFWPLFADRLGVAYERSRLVNIPYNRIQEEFANRAGTLDTEVLLLAWEEGQRMEIEALDGYVNAGVHEEVELRLVAR